MHKDVTCVSALALYPVLLSVIIAILYLWSVQHFACHNRYMFYVWLMSLNWGTINCENETVDTFSSDEKFPISMSEIGGPIVVKQCK